MKYHIITRGSAAAATLIAVIVVYPIAVLAQTPQASDGRAHTQVVSETHSTSGQAEELRTTTSHNDGDADHTKRDAAHSKAEEKRIANQGSVDAEKLKACQNREKRIQSKLIRVSDQGSKQLEVFTKISERTQAFYTKKGNTVTDYDALVKQVEAKKLLAINSIAAIKTSAAAFSCTAENPKASIESIKTAVQTRNSALKDYKTAVKDLIVAVKSAQSNKGADQ